MTNITPTDELNTQKVGRTLTELSSIIDNSHPGLDQINRHERQNVRVEAASIATSLLFIGGRYGNFPKTLTAKQWSRIRNRANLTTVLGGSTVQNLCGYPEFIA